MGSKRSDSKPEAGAEPSGAEGAWPSGLRPPASTPPSGPIGRFARLIARVFSSVWLAVFLILSLGIIAGLGTMFGLQDDVVVWGKSTWYAGLLFLLGLNILGATLTRYPFRLHHIPWLFVHLGVETILLGGILTSLFHVEGQVILQEGGSTDRLLLHSRKLSVIRPALDPENPAHARAANELIQATSEGFVSSSQLEPWLERIGIPYRKEVIRARLEGLGREDDLDDSYQLKDGLTIRIEKYYPHFREREEVREVRGSAASSSGRDHEHDHGPDGHGGGAYPAIHIEIAAEHFDAEDHWLLAEHHERQGMTYPTLDGRRWTISYATVGNQDFVALVANPPALALDYTSPAGGPAKGTLTARRTGAAPATATSEPLAIDVAASLGQTVMHEGFAIQVVEAWDDFVLRDGQPQDGGRGRRNAAVRVLVRTPDGAIWPRLLFADRPDANGDFDPVARYREPLTISFVRVPSGDIFLIVARADGSVSVDPLQRGESLPFPIAPGARVKLLQSLERAELVQVRESTDGEEDPAIQVTASAGRAATDTIWLPHGPMRAMMLGGQRLVLLEYTYDSLELPFEVGLEDFNIQYYPGTEQPKEFESFVWVHDRATNRSLDGVHIFMNNPMHHGGVRLGPISIGEWIFFQSSYQQPMTPGGPWTSVFSVSYDPGKWPFYIGSIILVCGLLAIFYVKPWLVKVESRRLAARALAARAARGEAAAAGSGSGSGG